MYANCKCRLPLQNSAKFQDKEKFKEISNFFNLNTEKGINNPIFVMNINIASPFILSLQKIMLTNIYMYIINDIPISVLKPGV